MTTPGLTLSFVVPAHDEETVIGGTLGALGAAARTLGRPFEIVVVDDGSTDRTGAMAAADGARVVRIDRRHIAAARNAGAAATTGEVLVFVDADTTVDAAVLTAAVTAMEGGAVGGGATLSFDEPVPAWVRAGLPVFRWAGRRLRLASGCFIFCARPTFEAVGGFDETLYAGEEIALSRALKKRGRFVILREAVRTSGRKFRTHALREMLATMAVLAFWPWSVRSRRWLDLWYGRRRADRSVSP